MIQVGVVGCGRISAQYLRTLRDRFGGVVKLAACADLNGELAAAVAKEYEIPVATDPASLYAREDVEVVLNLTNPWAHREVNEAALAAGKHVYTEKPLALTRGDAQAIIDAGIAAGLRVGCAPDTFLGAGLQTCRKLIDGGWIGSPSVIRGQITMHGARMMGRYQTNRIGGVLLDMGPYYVTAMIALFGPAHRVSGMIASASGPARGSDPSASSYGQHSDIETPVTVAGTMEFQDGVLGQIVTTTVADRYGPSLEVVGSEGTLICNDPNMFGGPVLIKRGHGEPKEVELTHRYPEASRGLGLVEMMKAVEAGRPHRANAMLGFHALDVMLSLLDSANSGTHIDLTSSCDRPAPMPFGRHIDPFV